MKTSISSAAIARRTTSAGVLFAALLLLSKPSDGADTAAIRAAMSAADVPGVAMAVIRGSDIGVTTFGTSAPGGNDPVTGDTVFEAASLSKTVFAAMFLKAVAAGQFSLDEPLADTRASLRVADRSLYDRLTPRLVLSHQSGLPNWAGDARNPDRTDSLEFHDPPGTRYGYSGEGYELLRAHTESRSGLSLEDWFAQHRSRFGMTDSHYALDSVPPSAAVAQGESSESNRAVSASASGLAAASLITTAPDYAHFIRYLLAEDELAEDLFSPQVTVEDSDDGVIRWALGWGVFERPDGSRVVFHWGDNWQFKAFVAIDPDRDVGVVYFANAVNGLELVPAIVEPVVGDLQMVRDWLGYEDP